MANEVPLKVFISHSAKNDNEAETLLAALSQRLKTEKFAPRIDRENLVFGEPWRQEINTWLTYCDAAVLLLSRKAVESPFVAYEVSVLCHRKSRNPKFTVLPLLLGDVDFNNPGTLLAPAQVMEIQPDFYKHASIDGTLEKVVEGLKKAEAAIIPRDTRTAEVIELLKKTDADKFRHALALLKVDLGPWDPVEDAYLSAAVQLMSVSIEDAATAIEQMKGKWTVDELTALYRLVACSWVDMRAADIVREIAFGDPAKRNLALTATRPELVELFGIRSFGQLPNDDNERWWVANINAVFGELASEELTAKVRRELCEVMKIDDEADLPKVLAAVLPRPKPNSGPGRPEKPVFVSMQASAFPRQMLEDLRNAFDRVTYFFLTGDRIQNASVFQSAGVEQILPELHAADEAAFAEQYDESLTWLTPAGRRRSSNR